MKTTSSLTIFRLALTLIGGCFAASLVLPAGTAAARAFSDDGQIAAARRSGSPCDEGVLGDLLRRARRVVHDRVLEPGAAPSRLADCYYNQPAGIPAGLLDSNIVIDAGNGNRAVGRCTLDMTTGLGLCTFLKEPDSSLVSKPASMSSASRTTALWTGPTVFVHSTDDVGCACRTLHEQEVVLTGQGRDACRRALPGAIGRLRGRAGGGRSPCSRARGRTPDSDYEVTRLAVNSRGSPPSRWDVNLISPAETLPL